MAHPWQASSQHHRICTRLQNKHMLSGIAIYVPTCTRFDWRSLYVSIDQQPPLQLRPRVIRSRLAVLPCRQTCRQLLLVHRSSGARYVALAAALRVRIRSCQQTAVMQVAHQTLWTPQASLQPSLRDATRQRQLMQLDTHAATAQRRCARDPRASVLPSHGSSAQLYHPRAPDLPDCTKPCRLHQDVKSHQRKYGRCPHDSRDCYDRLG